MTVTIDLEAARVALAGQELAGFDRDRRTPPRSATSKAGIVKPPVARP
jgi:hypothetical protein